MRTLLSIIVGVSMLFPGIDKFESNPDVDPAMLQHFTPGPAKQFVDEYNLYLNAPLEVARVFGRNAACAEADTELINLVAKQAVRKHVDPRVAAAAVAVESGCNQFAISTRGAIGLMQVRVVTWKARYDFAGDANLLNRETNLEIGTEILADYIRQYGLQRGVQLYNGAGEGCETCDAGYSNKILSLAGRK
jgi:hypothetical protein